MSEITDKSSYSGPSSGKSTASSTALVKKLRSLKAWLYLLVQPLLPRVLNLAASLGPLNQLGS